jgi:signal transduction histidine kinase
VGGVFEIIQDLSEEYQSILKLQYLIFGLSICIMGLIFVALLLIVHRAEQILEERAREQRELEAQLNQAERLAALGRMCAGVSHEIRNPLGIIRSTAELLSSMPEDKEAQKRLSNVIIEESGRLNNTVTEFLDFARPQEPNLQECDLEEIIRKNISFLQPELDKENIAVKDNLNNRSLRLQADPQLLYRAFLNLFANAIQSMQGGGTLSINVYESEDGYAVRIRDTGMGIGEENLGRIFDPFFSTKDKGSGLGLSIVKNIIESHKGLIRIESRKEGGTEVVLELPGNRQGTRA